MRRRRRRCSQAEAALLGGPLGCTRAPLLLDPHGHAEAWLRTVHGGRLLVASCATWRCWYGASPLPSRRYQSFSHASRTPR